MTICLECKNLTGIFEYKLAKYLAARSAMFYQISTEFAAKQQVDMERARNDKEEHQLICPFVVSIAALGPHSDQELVPV